MSQAPLPNIAYGQYIDIVKFIARRVREETTVQGDEVVGVRGKRVRQIYLNQFADQDRLSDEEYVAEQKQLATDVIKYMTSEHVLKAVKWDDRPHFIIHPSCKVVDDMTETPKSLIDQSTGSPDPRQDSIEAGGTIEVQPTAHEDAEVDRHAEAYSEMTELAVPLQPSTAELHLDTPSRKRRRTDEIAASDASSRFDSLSPRRPFAASASERRSRCLATPDETRRQSAPSRLGNRRDKLKSPMRMHNHEDEAEESAIKFKEEKKNPSPSWLSPALESLRSKYPNENFVCENESIRCLDCNGRTFEMGSGRNMVNIHRHMNGKLHKDNVASRILRDFKVSKSDTALPSFFQCQNATLSNFPPPQPVQCFSLPNMLPCPSTSQIEPDFATARTMIYKYFEALENDNSARRVQSILMGDRLATSERNNKEQFDKINELLTASEDRNKKLSEELVQSLAIFTQKGKEQTKQDEDRVSAAMRTMRDQAEELEGRVELSEKRNKEHIDQMAARLTDSETESRNRVWEVHGRLASFERDSKAETCELADRVDAAEERNQELIDGVLAQVTDSESRLREQLMALRQRLAASEGITKDQLDTMIRQLQDSEKMNKDQIEQLTDRISGLEKAIERHSEMFYDLEAQSQLHSEELQRQRDNEEVLRQTMSAQMEAHFQQTTERIQDLEKETSERIQNVEKASAERVKALEETNTAQAERLNALNDVFPVIFKGMNDLQEYVQSLEESIREQKSKSTKPRSRRRTNGMRTSRIVSSPSQSENGSRS